MPQTVTQVPVIDCSSLTSSVLSERKEAAQQIYQACQDVGFLYLNNHSIAKDLLDRAFADAKAFFDLPLEVKSQLAWSDESNYLQKSGYIPFGKEVLDTSQLGDLKEVLDIGKEAIATWRMPPGQELFQETIRLLYDACSEAANCILRAIAIALDLPEEFLVKAHDHNDHELRFLHYPPLKTTPVLGQLRAGAHSDYGSITLVFQNAVGGLEVKTKWGEWISVPYIQDTIVVNIGNLMQRWTNDIFVSNDHRVANPVGEQTYKSRYSIAFFCHPNSDTEISCLNTCQSLDTPPLYPPIKAGDYIMGLLQKTIQSS